LQPTFCSGPHCSAPWTSQLDLGGHVAAERGREGNGNRRMVRRVDGKGEERKGSLLNSTYKILIHD